METPENTQPTPDLAELLRRIAEFFTEFEELARESGYESVGDFLDAIVAFPHRQPSQVGWPPEFEFELVRHSTTPQGHPVLALYLHNIDRDLTSFEFRNADFGTAQVLSFGLGSELEDLSWFPGFNQDTGRGGAFQSSIREYDDNPSEYESIILCTFTLSEDSYVEIPNLGLSGNYDRGKGYDEFFSFYDFAPVTYFPDEEG